MGSETPNHEVTHPWVRVTRRLRKNIGNFDRNLFLIKRLRQRIPVEYEDRFWSYTDHAGGWDSCWTWTRTISISGYGVFSWKSKHWMAHRFAVMLLVGNDLGQLLVCHKCDNRKCCNPAHLFVGTHSDNMQDCADKGRLPQGESHSCAKVTQNQVSEILLLRKKGWTYNAIGAHLGTNKMVPYRVCNGMTWRRITNIRTKAK